MSHLIIRAVAIALFGLVLSWLLLSGNSPAADWLSGHALPTNLASAANLPIMLFALGSYDWPAPPLALAVAAMVLQWLLYGLGFSWLWGRLRPSGSIRRQRHGQAHRD